MNILQSVKPNQLAQNGNFTSTEHWGTNGDVTQLVSNNVMTINRPTSTAGYGLYQTINVIPNHKYLYTITARSDNSGESLGINAYMAPFTLTNEWQRHSTILSFSYTPTFHLTIENWTSFQAKNIMIFDLTELYGAGNEPTTVEQFEADFPLEYYDYRLESERSVVLNQGKALTLDGIVLPESIGMWNLAELNWIAETEVPIHSFFVTDLRAALVYGDILCSNQKYRCTANATYENIGNLRCSISNTQLNPILRIRDDSFNDNVIAFVNYLRETNTKMFYWKV